MHEIKVINISAYDPFKCLKHYPIYISNIGDTI